MALRSRFDDFALIGFIASVAAILSLAFAGYWASARQARASDWVAHSRDVQVHIARARSDVMEILGLRDEAYPSGTLALRAELASLRELVRDNADQTRRLDSLESGLLPRLAALDRAGAMDAVTVLSSMDGEEQRLLGERVRDEERTLTWVRFTSLVTIAVMLLVLAVLYALERNRWREHEARLRSEQRFHLMTQNVHDYAIFMLDLEGRVASWNYGAERIKGWAAHEIIGQHFSRFYPGDVPRTRPDEELAIAASRGRHSEDGWRVRKDGSRFWANSLITALRDEAGELLGFAKVTRDLTDRKQAEDALRAEVEQRRLAEEALREMIVSLETVIDERTNLLQAAVMELSQAKHRLEDLAQHDPLTGLPNRRLLVDRLRQATSAARRRARSVGVLFLDLDRFKEINDTRGHDAGDAVLQQVARRLQSCVREADTVAREGGDEFVVVLPDLEVPEDAMRVADKMLVELARPMDVGGAEIRITPSIGISHYPRDSTDIEELIDRADRAMYTAKSAGRNTIRSFT